MANNLTKVKGVTVTLISCRKKKREQYARDYDDPRNKTGFHLGAEAGMVFYETTMDALKHQIYTVISGNPVDAPPKGPKHVIDFILKAPPGEPISELEKKYIAQQMAKYIFDSLGFWCGMMVYTVNQLPSEYPGKQQLILYLVEVDDETGYKYLNEIA